jgi:hypothetical protein
MPSYTCVCALGLPPWRTRVTVAMFVGAATAAGARLGMTPVTCRRNVVGVCLAASLCGSADARDQVSVVPAEGMGVSGWDLTSLWCESASRMA